MKYIGHILISATLIQLSWSCGSAQPKARKGLTGNNISEFIRDKQDSTFYTDPIDDTINFKKWIDKIYLDRAGKIYIKTACFIPISPDTLLFQEYFKDYSDLIDIKTYKEIGNQYFTNRNKVYVWCGNSDGEMPMEIKGADAKTFVLFDSIDGGIDKNHVYYGGPPAEYRIIEGANPKTIRVLNPSRGCGNCGNCYFADDKHVFFDFKIMEGADPKTFKLVNKKTVDAEDKNGKYFEGQLIK